MTTILYSVTYPKVDYANPSHDPVIANYSHEKGIQGFIRLASDSIPREEVCDMLFAGFGNHPDDKITMPRWKMAKVRSMSVGDVINFENSDIYYICDSCGWLTVTKEQAASWLAFPRKYGCSSFELNSWKSSVGLDKE